MIVAVVGGGPAGLMAAETAANAGAAVTVFEAMPTPGRKLLRAGVGGLNLTREAGRDAFLSAYSAADRLRPFLQAFGPAEVRAWADGLGAETFVGSSGKVFPRAMKAAPLLRAWLARLDRLGVRLHTRRRWVGWSGGALAFDGPDGRETFAADRTVLALGGPSWPRLGGNADWAAALAARGAAFAPWRPANCGFDIAWSVSFAARFAGTPVPTATFRFGDRAIRGNAAITAHGIEGGAVYALAAELRDAIAAEGTAILTLDLAPDRPEADLARALGRPRGSRSLATHLKRAGIDGLRAALARETAPGFDALPPARQARALKAAPLRLLRPRPLAEAISAAGGVTWASVDDRLRLKTAPEVILAGEMLDWEAPTGGYLITACLATGRAAGAAAAA
ncbi:conserved hypothetical protein [uncultured Alphaproteobacteria bacterium]|uniref:NAD(FAD)-utilizing dehydrogenase n=1 Tax=uncultured Alphaproteobacteria bacterium TaxID=91750 RepID=A0A212JL91_9PROT|nr:conserved hypothetical protein [uncultured Alphaproteobacteria bacterium]